MAMLLDELVSQRDSRAKKVVAFFRMSRSSRLGGHPKCTTRGHLKMYQGSVGT